MLKRSLSIALVAASLLAANASSARKQPPAFPVTVAAANGKVTLTRQPRRIVSLSPSATETLFAIGADRQVVAVDEFSDYPRGTPRTKLSPFTPSPEATAKYRPDLVITSIDASGFVRALRRLRIPVLLQPAPKKLAEAYEQIEQLGRATGHPGSAAALVARMKKRIAQLVASGPRRPRPFSVYHEVSPDFYSATSKTFIGQIYALFGLRNIADAADAAGSGFPQLSAEYILASDPDLIVLADVTCCGQSKGTVAARPGWSRLTAVKNGAIVLVDDSIAARWGPRVVNFVRAIARALNTIAR